MDKFYEFYFGLYNTICFLVSIALAFIVIKLMKCKYEAKQFKEFDYLFVTGGKRKTAAGGIIFIVY